MLAWDVSLPGSAHGGTSDDAVDSMESHVELSMLSPSLHSRDLCSLGLDGAEDDIMELGGVTCLGAAHCAKVCSAGDKFCVEYANHPYKSGLKAGDLYDCIDSVPSAKAGGSYTCLYRYENGDACIFSYAAKFGPIHPPAPRPLCVYKSK